MSDYEFLTVDTLTSYIESRPVLAGRVDTGALASVEEIGDGNLNLVFLVKDRHGRGLCLKQALPYVRMTGEGWPMTPDRARHEVESLKAHHALIPDHVVEVFDYNPDRYIIAMEDLSDHQVWRGALNQGLRHDGAAEAMGTYVGAVAFGTSALGLERDTLADALAAAVNPALCTITEDLVFTEPLVDAGRNSVLPANEKDAAELAGDDVMVRAMGRAKWLFMTKAEALIHGDLHTGSVMVRSVEGSSQCGSVKAFDSEFAFYGPVAFDLGALWGNYIIAAARAFALGEDERASWALGLVQQTWDGFEAEFRRRWPSRLDPRVWRDGTMEDLLRDWEAEAWLFAAAKMSRRIVGAAKTADIETLPAELREGAARGVLQAARTLVRQNAGDNGPRSGADRIGAVLAEHRTR
ncbi:S-methyl-5-thioribose kinase [Nocardioides sp.]|uniref:S-methyl-5-thioribose kinase n=1 Tax=Nocardioides sp. TaxID=35761 RepID=UPI002629F280|nr:S-methyl-5-thioribose kinase [Nocardioides sp.]MDI6910608.1 S-methyl-5-thioribose kinase [Nocardioides sp.]